MDPHEATRDQDVFCLESSIVKLLLGNDLMMVLCGLWHCRKTRCRFHFSTFFFAS